MSKKKSAIKKLQEVDASNLMGQLLAKSNSQVRGLTVGQKVEGKVTGINNNSLVLDIGAKAEGVIGDREFGAASMYIKSLKVGDKVTATVVTPETSAGQVLLSLRDAAQESGWKTLEEGVKTQETVDAYVVAASRGGLTVTVSGIEGFVPLSQLSAQLAKHPQGVIGKTIQTKVQDVDRKEQKVVLSERAVSEKEMIEQQQKVLESIKKGDRFKGKVVGLVAFGAFVQITKDGISLEGLVHLSELSWERVQDSASILENGQEVEVVVIGPTSREAARDGAPRLALSIKQAQVDPWEKKLEEITKESRVKGKVTKLGDFGAYLEIKPGVEGQVKLNKIPDGVSLREGDLVDVSIEEIDKRKHTITLGLVLTTKPVGYK